MLTRPASQNTAMGAAVQLAQPCLMTAKGGANNAIIFLSIIMFLPPGGIVRHDFSYLEFYMANTDSPATQDLSTASSRPPGRNAKPARLK
jgi:hypothetical protein